MPTDNATNELQSKNISSQRRVAQLTLRRMATFDYLKRLFLGKGYHMGTVAIPMRVLAKIYSTPQMKKRSGQLFQLGLGIGKLLRIADSAEFGKAFDALLSEFDVAIGDSPSKQKNSLFSRLNKTFGDQQLNNDGLSAYGLLEIVQLPFELDFIETYITLCEILVLSYSKLLPARGSDCPDSHFECVHRLDLKIKKHIIHSVIREINGAAKLILEEQFHALANGE